MAQLKLTMALSHYDRLIPIFDGTVQPEGLELTVLEVGESKPLKHGSDRHGRMLRKGEFDICELSLSSYLTAKSRGNPFTEERHLVGEDPWPYGVKRNQANLERFMGYSLDQGLMERD